MTANLKYSHQMHLVPMVIAKTRIFLFIPIYLSIILKYLSIQDGESKFITPMIKILFGMVPIMTK